MMVLALLACVGGKDAPDDSPVTDTGPFPEGQLALRFDIDADYRDAMDEPALGNFRGSFWRSDEVEAIGPIEGAQDLGSISVDNIDLTGDATAVLFTSEPLPPIEVTVLGFLDSDGNMDPDNPDPDNKDPVTLPNENGFHVVSGETVEVTVWFGFLSP